MWLLQRFTALLRVNYNARRLYTYIYAMDKAYLRHSVDKTQFDISFHYYNAELRVDRQFNFTRNLNEPISAFLTRVIGNFDKIVNKKKKKKKGLEPEETPEVPNKIEAVLIENNKIIDQTTICDQVFQGGRNITLKLNEKLYKVIINSPYINGLGLPSSMLANFPVYPNKFDAVNTNKELCEYTWSVSRDKESWREVGTGFMYTPTNNDINSFLKLTCLPKNEHDEGPIAQVIADVPVDASPGNCPFEYRHVFTENKCKNDEFRIVTYNILADLYCDSVFTRTVLHPYCPPYALNIDYRKQLIIKELLGYNSDIICLQEVDKKVYNYDLTSLFSMLNYGSVFSLKGNSVAEGLACFYDKSRFEFLESSSIILAEQLEKLQIFFNIAEKVAQNERLLKRILQRTTALQIVVLKSIETGNIVLIGNTHLYFHPDSDHIRLIQGALCIQYIQFMYAKLKERFGEELINIVFCGDFNSIPQCGIYQLYTTGFVPEDFIDFKSNEDEAITGLDLKQPFSLASACGTPAYTNFTKDFQDCLDYIYYDTRKLSVVKSIPLPTKEELTQNVALPSIVFPSDHLPLIADVKFINVLR
ncbi:2',5'-phosphodiesterase 12 [Onthophagus taurus]|uniref:2',5'-phosphodiesterase 12 n=1 Tax=Onthophagus taurus TaxID=166361 RepID=UPI0039BEA0CC